MEDIQEKLDKLASGELKSLAVEKEEFMAVRNELIGREDFKQFRGEAGHNGRVIYTYHKVPRN
ncbi:hypothetical protein [Indiicoccus explosivorum]|uniref:hypothetical protein n=1 Tax=Indiicoccus explosivorum TaxID=1917864 RepID=UPI000B450D07|nr:hypothetical protein [Indiicoccus explosivorum]